MSEASSKSRVILIGLAVAAIIIAAGIFIAVPRWEEQQAEAIKALLAEMSDTVTCDSVKVGFWGKKITLSGVKAKLKYEGVSTPVTAEMASLELSGVNTDSPPAKGIVDIADSIVMTQGTMLIPMNSLPGGDAFPFQEQRVSFSSFAFKDLRGDLNALYAAIQTPIKPQTLWKAALSVTIGSTTIKDYVSSVDMGSGMVMVSKTESWDIQNLGMLSVGKATADAMTITFMGQEIVKMASMGFGEVRIPDFIRPTLDLISPAAEEQTQDPTATILAELEKTPLIIRDFTITDLLVRPMMIEPISLKGFSLDMELRSDKLTLKHTFTDLSLPPSIYRQLSDEAAMLAKSHQKALLLSGGLEAQGSRQGGKGDLSVKNAFLKEPDLGAASFDLDLLFKSEEAMSLQELLDEGPEWLLAKGRTVLEDKGLTTAIFAAQAERGKGFSEDAPDAAAIRAMMVQEIRAEAESEKDNPDAAAIFEGLAKLLEKPGTLIITLNPATPQKLENTPEPGALKASAEYTPAQ